MQGVSPCFNFIFHLGPLIFVLELFILNLAGFMDCATECWEHPLFVGKSSRLQLYPWSQVLRSKDPYDFFNTLMKC